MIGKWVKLNRSQLRPDSVAANWPDYLKIQKFTGFTTPIYEYQVINPNVYGSDRDIQCVGWFGFPDPYLLILVDYTPESEWFE